MSSHRMTVGTVEATFDNHELIAAHRESERAWPDRIAEIFQPYMMALHNACATVLALGYKPEHCMIVVDRPADGRSEKRTLEVLGKPCFEVTIETKTIAPPDYTFDVATS